MRNMTFAETAEDVEDMMIAQRSPRTRRFPGVLRSLRLQGQATLEYAVFTAVVAAALVAMNVYVRRSIQANLKQLEDQINAEAVP